MSTRCNVIVMGRDGKNDIFYHHSDGYPDGVGKELLMFSHFASKNQESTYMDSDGSVAERNLNDVRRKFMELLESDGDYEHDGIIHSDIDYMYLVEFVASRTNIGEYADIKVSYVKVGYDEIQEYEKQLLCGRGTKMWLSVEKEASKN